MAYKREEQVYQPELCLGCGLINGISCYKIEEINKNKCLICLNRATGKCEKCKKYDNYKYGCLIRMPFKPINGKKK